MKKIFYTIVLISLTGILSAQKPLFEFGKNVSYESILSSKKVKSEPLQWFQVNMCDTTDRKSVV